MGLTVENFFRYYMLHPCAQELPAADRCKAIIASCALAVFAGLAHLICWLALYQYSFKLQPPSAHPKVTAVATEVLQLSPPKPQTSAPTQPVVPTPIPEPQPEDPTQKRKLQLTSLFPRELPPLLNLELDATHPVSHDAPATLFLNSDADAALRKWVEESMQQYFTSYELLESPGMDADLLEVPLSYFLDSTEERYRTIVDDPNRSDKKEIIEVRFAALDTSIQLKERLKRLNNSAEPTVKDLLIPWNHSMLKYILMMDDEVVQLQIGDLSKSPNMDSEVSERTSMTISKRVLHFNERNKGKLPLAETQVTDTRQLFLFEIPHLKAAQVNALSECPAIIFILLSLNELKLVRTDKLLPQTLNCVFRQLLVQLMTQEQVNVCFSQVGDVEVLANLTDEQCVNLDATKANADIVSAIFVPTPEHDPRAGRLIPKLTVERLYQYGSLFTPEHWKYLTLDQVKQFDFKRITLTSEIVIAIFSSDNSSDEREKQLIPQLSVEQLYALSEYFSLVHWEYLTLEQIKKFDFKRIELSKPMVNAIFSPDDDSDDKEKQLIPQLSVDQLYTVCNFFEEYHWAFLTPDQVKQIDFKQVTLSKKVVKAIFSPDVASDEREAQLIPLLSPEKIYVLSDYFDADHWQYLTPEQIKQLDFRRITLTNERVDDIFSPEETDDEREKTVIPELSLEQLDVLRSYFDERYWDYLTPDQIKRFDFKSIKLTSELVNTIFSTHAEDGDADSRAALLLGAVSKEQAKVISEFLTPEARGYLDLGGYDTD